MNKFKVGDKVKIKDSHFYTTTCVVDSFMKHPETGEYLYNVTSLDRIQHSATFGQGKFQIDEKNLSAL